jgi:hypothetical protein
VAFLLGKSGGNAPFTHELMCLRNIDIYRSTFSHPPPRPPSFFLPYRAASAGEFREFVSKKGEVVEFLGFFCELPYSRGRSR